MDVTQQSQQEWLSTGDAAKELAVSRKSIVRWIERGLIPARRIRAGGQYRVSRATVEHFKAQQEVRPISQEDGASSRPN